MISFFQNPGKKIYAVDSEHELKTGDIKKFEYLFSDAILLTDKMIEGKFLGARREMISPKSTNSVDIAKNMGIEGIRRIEEFFPLTDDSLDYDPMLQEIYTVLNLDIFTGLAQPESLQYIDDIEQYSREHGLALSIDEIQYLENLSQKIGRQLTDSEVFGFSQVNSEHCRHKIFNGEFILDGQKQKESLFALIKKTSETNPNTIVSAYKDNCAFIQGAEIKQFAPETHEKADFFTERTIESVISLKAETHNFPTTVEAFNGAATGTGGEIRDRMAGGTASIPISGTAVYMTSYPRIDEHSAWAKKNKARKWLYQSPEQILIKASNGASDFGNKFGQPLICGSVFTFEHAEKDVFFGFDKVIMLAGGVGYTDIRNSKKLVPEKGDLIIVAGGDNYRIGLGGGAVSSVATGEYDNAVESNAVQRSNPEMQKRVANVIRAFAEMKNNPIVSIHDHGAGGHLNCLSELVENSGGIIEIEKLPPGDSTMSAKEIIGNESQERMGLVIKAQDLPLFEKIARRERAPFFVVGEVNDNMRLVFSDSKNNQKPIDLTLDDMFGKTPKTVLTDTQINRRFDDPKTEESQIAEYLKNVLLLESVACKDWLTNKVDRSVTGKIAQQQTCGSLQLPLNDCGVTTLDFSGQKGIATSIGHAPVAGLIDPEAASRLSVAEALTNTIGAPLSRGIQGISLSANWMWPVKNEGENDRLYRAVKSLSDFCIDLKINVPTGKDSLSMTQKYKDGTSVMSPGTVIVSTVALVDDVKKTVGAGVNKNFNSRFFYIDFSSDSPKLGGSAFYQTLNAIGSICPDVKDTLYFSKAFEVVQKLIFENKILALHDVGSGGLVTTLLEMIFPENEIGMDVDISMFSEENILKILFSENPGIVFQTKETDYVSDFLKNNGIKFSMIGKLTNNPSLFLHTKHRNYEFDIEQYRDIWFKKSFMFDSKQCSAHHAEQRFENYKKHELKFDFRHFTGKATDLETDSARNLPRIKTAIIREQGSNGDREMAYALYAAGMQVKDIHMTDLISGEENLEDVQMIVFTGGFSNSDVLGSAKGWAGTFLFNLKAKAALDNFYKRPDTLSLGVCNGCQLMMELGLIVPEHKKHPKMRENKSLKFESGFVNVTIQKNNSVMLSSMESMRLGVWVAHGEGRFDFPEDENRYHIPVKYSYDSYPANPNGSPCATAAICSNDGRHLAIMPHPERALAPWQWANYPGDIQNEDFSPWIEAFVNARKWLEGKK